MQMYEDQHVEDSQTNDRERRERKKKKHRRQRDENQIENEMHNGKVTLDYDYEPAVQVTSPRRSEEENFEPGVETKRKHRHRRSKIENTDYGGEDEPVAIVKDEEEPMTLEEQEEARRLRREKKRRARERKKSKEDSYQHSVQSPTEEVNNYPFEGEEEEPYYPGNSTQLDEQDGGSYREEEDLPVTPPPEEPKPKKKTGGFAKLFASFKKKNKAPKETQPADRWQSTPELFNPGYDSQVQTLDKPKNQDQHSAQSPTEEWSDYPFDGQEDEPDGGSYREEPPPEQPTQKKKTGGFRKLFSSFKNKSKARTEKPPADHSQSTPELFNPGYDSRVSTLEKPKQKSLGKSHRGVPECKAHIILLDGEEVEVDIDQKFTGSNLFDKICSELDLIEKDYFGMTYVNSKIGTWFWLDMEKKIAKQLGKEDDWTFNFQVKFYPPEPVLLQEDITRYFLSLQVRQDVFTGKLPCSWITQALLGSFMVQSELGDYDELENGNTIDYIRDFEFVMNQSEQLLEKISELHRKLVGMSPDKADIKYLETAKRLEQYGVDLHPARDNDDVEIFIGVSYQGVLIYRDRLRIGRFAWPKVLRLSYKKNYFYLKIRSDRYDDSVAVVGFKLFNYNLAKRLWKCAAEQHTFFRMKEPQMGKSGPRLIPVTGSTFGYSGKTMHQYRTLNINRTQPAQFDRSVTKRRTIGSMPAGLNTAGMQYSSMHSLNRAHPRDMTLGKTKSVEHLSSRKPMTLSNDREGSIGSFTKTRNIQQPAYPGSGSMNSYKDDERHQVFHSGDSFNGGDSYTFSHDDQLSLPTISPTIPQEHTKPVKKRRTKTPSIDQLSDDGVISPTPKQPVTITARPNKSIPLPLPPDPHSSDTDTVESVPKPRRKKSHDKPPKTNSRPLPQFKPPPPPPDPIPEPPSISSSIRSSQMGSMPPPPPPPPINDDSQSINNNGRVVHTTTTVTYTERAKPPEVKPKPVVKPKPNVVTTHRTVVTKTSTHRQHDDDSSNDGML